MVSRGYKLEFAEQIFRQIEGFGEYGFPESHAASFALLVYVSAWLKCHEPAAFLCAMLNSLPMGFYSASQLIQDAKRHGVQIRPVDVTVSDWECTLEEQTDESSQSIASTAPALSMTPAVRLGLNRVKGMGREAAKRIMEARKISPFENTDDLASRALLNATEIRALASSDALLTLSGHRRQTLWAVASHIRQHDMMRDAPVRGSTAGHRRRARRGGNPGGLRQHRTHPTQASPCIVAPKLTRMNLRSAMELDNYPPGRLVRTTGIVTCRQRPGTPAASCSSRWKTRPGSSMSCYGTSLFRNSAAKLWARDC